MLLTISGAELFDEDDKEIRLSNDIWSFDTECVEDEKIYEHIVVQFTQLSKGKFVITKAESDVDFDNELAKISFEYNGINYNWDIVFADDWADFDLLRKLGNLANSNMDSKQYYYFHDGQQLTLICCDLESIKKLNNLVKNPYTLLC
ncbi:hypothetical protein [Brevibacillus sp. SYSU BS000544]|uniref:hypothetical protein n=1 Tax=Brevibacillus sp. SYSU BS000544 TaxID=3416443 RepID=UPI003CE50C80